ncbi:L-aspartate oxidase [Agriterribacter sp.]|uniref:L-aspartate oxidase n=1 Tax=Agriterribacter sp. TaxID=2821509 RepID=UPI002CD46496|nr:L-aspartate oxidase [Agriterribacter sp.]HTN07199.1 L-aspartate oxidase [Agriterribacter sp.]
MHTDFLVIGSGIAGLTYALKVARDCPDKKIIIFTKTTSDETNTKYAQGGIAGVWDNENDSFEKHIEDTLIAGDGLCNEKTVEIVVREGVDRIREIIEWGAKFDKEPDGDYALGKEGGHSEFRILHHKDVTGREMERALLDAIKLQPNIEVITHCFVVDIITQHHLGYLVTKSTPDIECFGVYALNLRTQKIETVRAGITLLATGGNGQVYRTTTNPVIATGDGVAMAYRAKGRIENMEFIQFHPTALYEAGVKGQAFLITEAVRGDGGILRNSEGEAFMERYDARKDLAPRDIVARAIDNEMKRTGTEQVWLDCRDMNQEKFLHHFPNIYEKCLSIGIDVAKNMIPVAPAAHYSCGGIKTDEWARTSIRHLYAAGECASTGLHGANRLASNSLLEAMVFAHRAYVDAVKKTKDNSGGEWGSWHRNAIPDWRAEGTTAPKEMILITQSLKELQLLMSDYVGIVRTNTRLERAMRRLDMMHEETEELYKTTEVSPQLCQLRNMITVGYLIVKSAQFRHESRGLHFNTDYPHKSGQVQNIVL